MSSKSSGYLFMFLSTFIYGFYGLFTHLLSGTFSPFYLSFLREGLAFLIIFFLTLIGILKWIKPPKSDLKWLIALGTIASIANILAFYTFLLIPIGLASFIVFTTSVIGSSVLGAIFYHEKFSKSESLSILLCILGLVFMFLFNIETLNVLGITLGIIFGLCISFFSVIAKKISGSYEPLQVYMISSGITSIINFVVALIIKESFPIFALSAPWLWFIIYSVSTVLSNGLYLLGFKKGVEVSIASIIMPLQCVVTAITGVIFLNQQVSANLILGGIMVFIASSIPYLSRVFTKSTQ